MYISIHAPTRGATKKAILQREKQAISIHAPTRGATISNGLCDGFYAIFQSTLPREERLVAKDFTEGMVVFQSTLPREERPRSEENQQPRP